MSSAKPGIWRAALGLPAAVYGLAVRMRNRRYDRPETVERVGLPVVSVGNLTAGGTGKTPLVAWLAQQLMARGFRPAVVSRGYGGTAGRGPLVVSEGQGPLCGASVCGDEPYLLAKRLQGTSVIVGSDRVRGAEAARVAGAQVVLLDDGFQHRRLARDLDIVLLDSGNPFGNHRLLPAGVLREPVSNLARADLILITRSEPDDSPDEIHRIVRAHNPDVPLLLAGHRRTGFVDVQGSAQPRPPRALAFCGIGNPERFRSDLEAEGVELPAFRPDRDHHPFTRAQLAEFLQEAQGHGARLVTTEKDLARIESLLDGDTETHPLALRIDAVIYKPEPVLSRLEALLS